MLEVNLKGVTPFLAPEMHAWCMHVAPDMHAWRMKKCMHATPKMHA